MLKICIKCGEVKEEIEFATTRDRKGNKRFLNSCKECMKKYKHSHYIKDQNKYKERSKRQRELNSEQLKEYNHNYYRKNKEVLIQKNKEYINTPKGKIIKKKCNKNYFSSPYNKMKHNARKKVLRAIESGKLIRPSKCELCGEELFCEAHHKDYNKPLEVIWLCKTCHENMHHLNEEYQSKE